MSSEEGLRPETSSGEKDRVRLINRFVGKRYEVLEFVGEGPLLSAFRSRDQQLNRIVTLKTLRSDYQNRPELVESLRTGFAETISLSHVAIARAYDVGEDEELTALYQAEEFVRGIDLRERIRRAAPFQLTAAVDITITLAEALEYAHHRGIPHGDLCPQNVLIGPDGLAKLTGFGIAPTYARIASEDSTILMRMAYYAAPDLVTSTSPSASADLYALAVILFEMLTGEAPFQGDNPVQIALRHAQEAPPAPRTINQAIPRALEGVVLKGLAKRPQERYMSATAFLEDLRQIREALRFGRSLAWSPLDARETAPVAASVTPTAPSTVRVMPAPTAAAPEAGRRVSQPVAPVAKAVNDERDSEEKTPPPRRTGGILLAINLTLFLALIGTVALVFNGIRPFLSPANEVIVPELRGKTFTEATAIANDRHFKLVKLAEEFLDDKPANVIFEQKEQPGTKILEGKEVTVKVSRGPEMVPIPNVEEMTLDKAQKELEKIGLKVGEVTRRFDSLTGIGVVLEQLPRSDGVERRARGTKIDLTLSKGPEPAPTPEPTPPPTPEPKESAIGSVDDPSNPVDMQQRTFRVPYKTPKDAQQHHVVIQIEDADGTHSGYDSTHGPGQSISVEVSGIGRPITIKLYDNDDLKAQTLAVKAK